MSDLPQTQSGSEETEQPLPSEAQSEQRRPEPAMESTAEVAPRPLLSLPLVMLQSTMHFLHAPELVQLARCCKWIADAVRCKFAWRHSLLQVRSYRRLIDLKPRAALCSPPIALFVRWDRSEYLSQSLALIDQTGLRLVQLHFDGQPSDATLRYALKQPCMQSLQVLRLPSAARHSQATLSAISRLPSLRTLEIHAGSGASDHWSSLAACASLTALETSDRGQSDEPNHLQVIAASCAQIRHLSITRVLTVGIPWTILRLPDALCFRTLESLTLSRFDMRDLGTTEHAQETLAAQLSLVFASMQRLSSLTLRRIAFIDRMLPTVASAPALRLLQIEVESDVYRIRHAGPPSESALLSLLSAAPQLHCSVVLFVGARPSEADLTPLSERHLRSSRVGRLQLRQSWGDPV